MPKVRLIPASLATTMVALKLFMIVVLLSGCTSAPDVRIDKAPAADLSTYQTFSFYEHLPTDRATYTSIMSARLKQSTRDALERHGYVYSEKNPDLKVNFDLRLRERQEIRSYPTNGGVFVRRVGLSDVDVVSYRQGTVSIDLVDNHLKSLVWQGIADGRIDGEMLDDPGRAIDTAVKHIFAGFPLSKKD